MSDFVGGAWDSWSADETILYYDAVSNIESEYGSGIAERVSDDAWVSFLYHEAMWDFEIPADYRGNAYHAFVEYMDEEYGIEWEDIFDWEAYRDAYDAA